MFSVPICEMTSGDLRYLAADLLFSYHRQCSRFHLCLDFWVRRVRAEPNPASITGFILEKGITHE